ncbi:MAG: hypothetical protein EXQ63_05505 [Ilumatobacteraceae bacterium]|nr:hypothetical protein [Ilumatobacteraceae bacterium]
MLFSFIAAVALCTPSLSAPVSGQLVRSFRAPTCEYCAGHRGWDIGFNGQQVVRAATTGIVTFSGTVAGTQFVVQDIGCGLRLTYGRLLDRTNGQGIVIVTGDHLGKGDSLGHGEGVLYLGVRRGRQALDPAPFFGRARARLVSRGVSG